MRLSAAKFKIADMDHYIYVIYVVLYRIGSILKKTWPKKNMAAPDHAGCAHDYLLSIPFKF